MRTKPRLNENCGENRKDVETVSKNRLFGLAINFNDLPDLLTAQEVALVLGLPHRRIYELVKLGKLPTFWAYSRQILVTREALLAFRKQMQAEAAEATAGGERA